MPVPIPLMSAVTEPDPSFLDLIFVRSLYGPRKIALTLCLVSIVKLHVGLVPQFNEVGVHPSKREPGEGVARRVIGASG